MFGLTRHKIRHVVNTYQWWKFSTKAVASMIGLFIAMNSLPAKAAEKITIAYNLLEFSVPVDSLEKFARKGEIDANLQEYTQYLEQPQIEQLRQILNRKVLLSAVDVSRLSNSAFGQELLSFIGNIVQTGPQQNGLYALRSSLILAADRKGFTLLEVIKKFPAPTLRVNSVELIELIKNFNRLKKLNEKSLDLVIKQSQQESQQLDNTAGADSGIRPKLQKWQKEKLSMLDPKRKRRIDADLYQPDMPQSTPLLVISPGLASNRSEGIFVELAEQLASNGFTVAVLEHSKSNTQQLENLLQGVAREVMEPSEFIDRPQDVSYLLDELERRNRAVQWQNRIDLSRIGVMGHSFGGYTAFALVGAQPDFTLLRQICTPQQLDLATTNVSLILQCQALKIPEWPNSLQDKRIQAAFVFNPVGSAIFGEAGIRSIKVPVFMVSGSDDELTPPVLEQVCPFTWLNTPQKYLAMIQGGSHNYVAANANRNRLFTLLGSTQADSTLAREHLKSLGLRFVKTHLQQQSSEDALRKYKPNQSNRSPYLIQNLSAGQIQQSLGITCPGSIASQASARN
jgi:predicted dienelactone hydrolase